MSIEINAPWTEGAITFKGCLGFIQQTKAQLLFYQKQNDTEHIRKDIEGYDLILESNSEENAENFLEVKMEHRFAGKKFANNLEVIEHLKKEGKWK